MGDDVELIWDEVIVDTAGNPISVSQYKVYSSDTPYFDANSGTLNGLADTNSFINENAAAYATRVFYKVTAVDGVPLLARDADMKLLLDLESRKTDRN